jgi:peptidoglycan/xylan/chitin deacetylase (PgdA/CDA1 family)
MFIVNYHNVLDQPLDVFDRRSLRIPVDEFRAEMRHLRDRFHPVPLTTLLDMAREGHVDPRAVAVTFDDGYAGVLRHGLPVMQELDIVATMFVITDALREPPGTLRHHDELEMAFRLTTASHLKLASFGYPDQPLESEADRMRCLLAVKRELKTVQDDLRGLAHRTILARLGVTPEQCRLAAIDDKHRMLDVDGLSRLIAAGWTVGSHSRSHRTLSQLGEDALRSEVAASREELERALGVSVTLFAYPYGGAAHVGDQAPRLVAASGYRYGLTAQPGAVGPETDWFQVPRVSFDDLMAMAH